MGRFAPSPTGALHLGHLQTLLLGWLQIRGAGGRFVLRIEDIDPSRTRPGATEAIIEDMRWLGFDWDEGPGVGGPASPYLQSQRLALYEEALARLRARTYRCTCTRKEARAASGGPEPVSGEWPYPGICREGESHPDGLASLRIRVDEGVVSWEDGWLGSQSQEPSRVCGDFILRSKAGDPTYQLAVVVDDIAMGVTEVLRGEDLLHSTARQILLYQWLGAEVPRFSHVPLRRDETGQRLAKSRGSRGLSELREEGADPRVVLGGIAVDLGLLDAPERVLPGELLGPWADSEYAARLAPAESADPG